MRVPPIVYLFTVPDSILYPLEKTMPLLSQVMRRPPRVTLLRVTPLRFRLRSYFFCRVKWVNSPSVHSPMTFCLTAPLIE